MAIYLALCLIFKPMQIIAIKFCFDGFHQTFAKGFDLHTYWCVIVTV